MNYGNTQQKGWTKPITGNALIGISESYSATKTVIQ